MIPDCTLRRPRFLLASRLLESLRQGLCALPLDLVVANLSRFASLVPPQLPVAQQAVLNLPAFQSFKSQNGNLR